MQNVRNEIATVLESVKFSADFLLFFFAHYRIIIAFYICGDDQDVSSNG